MTWSNVRQLTWCNVLDENGNGTVHTFAYGADGIRCRKNNIHYTCDGERILIEHNADTGRSITYLYGEKGVVGFSYRGSDYYYRKNLFGDVVAIYNTAGEEVATYEYDAWGKNLSCEDEKTNEIKRINPIRYRSYYYDVETGLYYVSSRYYDPEIGRWINADIPETLTADFENFAQYNLFAYCFNNPVNLSDETGTWPSWATKLAIGVGAIVIGAAVVAATAATGGAAAAFVGAAVAGLKAAAVSGAIGAAVGAGTSAVSHRVSTGSWSGAGKAAVYGAVDGFANGFMTGGIMAGGSQILSSGFKVAANAGVPTGRNGGLTIGNKVRVLSPNHPQAYEAGGTLLKIGSKYKNIRFDVGSNRLFHMNIQLAKTANYHIPIGMLGAGLWGGIARD